MRGFSRVPQVSRLRPGNKTFWVLHPCEAFPRNGTPRRILSSTIPHSRNPVILSFGILGRRLRSCASGVSRAKDLLLAMDRPPPSRVPQVSRLRPGMETQHRGAPSLRRFSARVGRDELFPHCHPVSGHDLPSVPIDMCQGTTSVVPKSSNTKRGFSPCRRVLGAPSLRSLSAQRDSATHLVVDNSSFPKPCHPEHRHLGAPVALVRKRGKPSEGSASRDTPPTTIPGAPGLAFETWEQNIWVPHPCGVFPQGWEGTNSSHSGGCPRSRV
jgi:hypothetical protein